jgi:hypothetical protein
MMGDPFVPEADALEQRQEVVPAPAPPQTDNDHEAEPALEYPEQLPIEAPEPDALEQHQTVVLDDELGR